MLLLSGGVASPGDLLDLLLLPTHVGLRGAVPMVGDMLYVTGTLLQLVAFALRCRPTTLGLSLALYGVGMFVYARRFL